MAGYTPVKLRHPETGEEIVTANAREENNLRFANGYVLVEEKPAPKPQAPKPAAKNDSE